jgi:hypothetical protein
VVKLCAGDDYLQAVIDIRSLGNMPPKTSTVMPAAFTVDVDESAPDGHVASFDIEIESDLERKISRHTVALNAPGLFLDRLSLSDSVDGNANGCLEAWEFLVLEGGWTNNGSVDIASPSVSISCPAGGWAKVIKHKVDLDDIPIGASVTLPPGLEIFISEDAPPFSPVEIELTFTGDNIAPRTESLEFTTCGYSLADPAGDASFCTHFPLAGYDGWRLAEDDFISAPVSWMCGGKDGQVYPNMTESCLVTPAVCLGDNTTLTFWHRMEAEASASYPYWARDASVVEISTDFGRTWQIIAPEGNYPCRAASTNTIFLPAYARCFSGTIGWKQEAFDLSAFRGPAMIRFHFASDEQYGFEGWYIDDITISTELTTDSGEPEGGAPRATRLLPAWPNPFNPSTTIPFELSSEGLVEIRLYDVSGRLVRELGSGRFGAGIHSVRWDGRDGEGRPVSSGVYFCRMKTGVYSATSRLVLLR